MAVNLQNVITQARQAGISDDVTLSHLQSQGLIDTEGKPTQLAGIGKPQVPEGAQLHDTGSFGGNLANSAGHFLSGIGNAIAHPLDTLGNIGEIAAGGLEKAGVPLQKVGVPDATPAFDNTINYFKQRYGSIDNFITTFKQDPVGLAADASVLLDGVGSVVSGAGKVSKIGAIADAGEGIANVGKAVNPLNAITKPIGAVADGVKNLASKASEGITNPDVNFGKVIPKKYSPEQVQEANQLVETYGPKGDVQVKKDWTGSTTQKMEDVRQSALETQFKDISTPTTWVQHGIESLKQAFFDNENYDAIVKTLDSKINSLDRYGESIPLSSLNKLKISANDVGYSELGGRVLNQINAQVGDIYRQLIEDTLDKVPFSGVSGEIKIPPELQKMFGGRESVPIQVYNQVFGKFVTAKKIFSKGINIEHPIIKIAGKATAKGAGIATGAVMGGPVGAVIGNYIGEAVGNAVNTPIGRKILVKGANATVKAASGVGKIRKVARPLTAGERANQSSAVGGAQVQ